MSDPRINLKNRHWAAVLAFLIPGAGHAYQGRYFFADYVQGRVWSIGLTIDAAKHEARAGNLIEHTAELGGTAQLGNISSFGVDADAELYMVGYSRGTILRVFGPPSAPSTPGGLRIIRP